MEQWLPSLITKTPQEGYELAITEIEWIQLFFETYKNLLKRFKEHSNRELIEIQ